MKPIAAILSVMAISFTAFAQENKSAPSYSLKWEDAQLKVSDLAVQCRKKPQTTISLSGGSEERVIRARCNINLPIDKIQAINKFPDQIVSDGTALQLNYSANVGAFTHTLHVTLLEMKGYRSSLGSRRDKGVIIVVPKGLEVDERLRIEDAAVAAIAAEIEKVLSQSQEIISGKVLVNALPVVDNGATKLMLPVSRDIFLETIRKYPTQFGLERPNNIDLD